MVSSNVYLWYGYRTNIPVLVVHSYCQKDSKAKVKKEKDTAEIVKLDKPPLKLESRFCQLFKRNIEAVKSSINVSTIAEW